MIYLEKIAILLIISLLDVLITITTSSTMMLFLIDFGIEKYTSLMLSMILSLLIFVYIKFNHKIRNYLLSQEGDK
jgi:accessory gene regulator protein AgrB